MKYNQPWDQPSNPNAPYTDGNPSTGTPGSIPRAAAIEYPQREIVNLLTDSSISPTNSDLHQIAKAIQNGKVRYALDLGTVNALNVTLTPAPDNLLNGLVIVTEVAVTNNGATVIIVNGRPAVPVVRRGNSPLLANDLIGSSMAMLSYSELISSFELYGAGFSSGRNQLTANYDLYVNGAIGSDSNDGISNTPAHALLTVQRAVDIAFGYAPSQYTITVHVAAGAYTGTCQTPQYAGPNLVISGAGYATTSLNGGSGYTFDCRGAGNSMVVHDISGLNSVPPGGPAIFVAESSAYLHAYDVGVGNAGNGLFQATQGGSFLQLGNCHYSGNFVYGFYANAGGYLYIDQGSTHTFVGSLTMTSFVNCGDLGIVIAPFPAPVFSGSSPTGSRYSISMNSILDASTYGTSYFPGTTAGSISTGGQYNS